ncbi:ATP-dependent DNA helicase RecQ-like [Ptychodera flava]|uniref:ATP-dependent DNA helicase RecQ-like n=1 Tax=Ptychodera flava TaxID=63121 RepID=UPI00396A1CD2
MTSIVEGRFNYVFSSPEAFLCQHRSLLLSDTNQSRVGAIFVDESHCIKKWGKEAQAGMKAFRQHYGQLGQLRSLLPAKVPVVTLTATATSGTRKVIIDDLCMKGCEVIIENPDKPNIKYNVINTDDDLETVFMWLVDEIKLKQAETPRVIIFCRRRRHCSELFELFSVKLGSHAFYQYEHKGQNDDRNRYFAMFHSKTDDVIKESIISSFQKPNGIVRVVFATSAFSMGMDLKSVDQVIHFGPPSDVEGYLQETGRVGRDRTTQSSAIPRRK